MATMPSTEAVAAALRKHGIDPNTVPAQNGIYQDGYLTLHEVRTLREPVMLQEPGGMVLGGVQHQFHEWPSEEARIEILEAWGA